MLNEKLQECFDLLDQIQRTYRNYNEEYIKIVNNYPSVMDSFFEKFEQASLAIFKRFPKEEQERIQALFEKETHEAQEKLEAEALKKWEEEKKQDEAKAEAEAKKAAADPKAKKAPPPKGKGGKESDKPNLDVPKLEVPKIVEYTSKMGQKYIFERSMDEITVKLLTPAPTEDDKKHEGDPNESPNLKSQDQSIADMSKAEVEGDDGEKEEEKDVEKPVVVENDFLEKASMKPPKDPEGVDCLVANLILTKDRLKKILEKALDITMEWLIQEK